MEGVILLLMITVVLCIVILCMRRCHQKADNNVSYNTTELNTDVTIHPNPSYDVTKVNTVDSLYNTIRPGDLVVKPGARRPKAGAPGLLKINSVRMYVCVDVCVSAPQAMNNYSRETESE